MGLLIVGAAIALGVDRWTDLRSEQSAEQAYLLALRADFEATDSIFRSNLVGHELQIQHNRDLIQLLAGEPGSVPVDSLSRLVREAFLWQDFVPVMATYEDMVNSGDLRLLRSDELRTRMASFVSYMEGIAPYNDGALAQWTNQVTPFFIEHFDVTDLYGPESALDMGTFVLPPNDWGPEVSRIKSSEAAFWSREFVNLVAVRTIGLMDAARFLSGAYGQNPDNALARIAAILDLIEVELVDSR